MSAHSPTPAPDPLAEAQRENQQLRQELARSAEQLQRFLYAAGHDLQEPLRGIITYAQLLERQPGTDPASREYTTFIVSSALRMRELLQQVLVYSRAGAAAKQRRVINLNVPLQMALMSLAPQIAASGAKVSYDSLPEAIGDENEISQVFHHLLSNSLKFRSAEPPAITVLAEQGTEECRLSVRDNGLGIDPRFCEQAILPFKRLHSSEIAGNGLGLAICEKIVRANQGRLWVESDGSRGTTVFFTLPV